MPEEFFRPEIPTGTHVTDLVMGLNYIMKDQAEAERSNSTGGPDAADRQNIEEKNRYFPIIWIILVALVIAVLVYGIIRRNKKYRGMA